MKHIKQLMQAWFWEFLQNAPLIMAFAYGFEKFRSGEILSAAGIGLLGAVTGALIIRFTENFIQPGKRESWRVTLTNVAFFGPAIALFSAYFSRVPANWLTDLIVGVCSGWLVSALQSWAAGESPDTGHSIAMAAAFSVAVLLIRQLVGAISPWTSILLINVAVTSVIVWIEYHPARTKY